MCDGGIYAFRDCSASFRIRKTVDELSDKRDDVKDSHSDFPRYLKEENCFETAKQFRTECIHLAEYNRLLGAGKEYPTNVGGLSLRDIIDEFGRRNSRKNGRENCEASSTPSTNVVPPNATEPFTDLLEVVGSLDRRMETLDRRVETLVVTTPTLDEHLRPRLISLSGRQSSASQGWRNRQKTSEAKESGPAVEKVFMFGGGGESSEKKAKPKRTRKTKDVKDVHQQQGRKEIASRESESRVGHVTRAAAMDAGFVPVDPGTAGAITQSLSESPVSDLVVLREKSHVASGEHRNGAVSMDFHSIDERTHHQLQTSPDIVETPTTAESERPELQYANAADYFANFDSSVVDAEELAEPEGIGPPLHNSTSLVGIQDHNFSEAFDHNESTILVIHGSSPNVFSSRDSPCIARSSPPPNEASPQRFPSKGQGAYISSTSDAGKSGGPRAGPPSVPRSLVRAEREVTDETLESEFGPQHVADFVNFDIGAGKEQTSHRQELEISSHVVSSSRFLGTPEYLGSPVSLPASPALGKRPADLDFQVQPLLKRLKKDIKSMDIDNFLAKIYSRKKL